MRWLPLGALLLSVAAATPAWSQAEAAPGCDMPPEYTTAPAPLPWVTSALSANGRLAILALGSGSTVGDTGGAAGPALMFHAPEGSFPYRMIDALRAMRPAQHFDLTVRGGRSMTAETMLPLLLQELATRHYDLVLWQTGTVEAVHGQRPDSLRSVLQDGAEATAKAQADLVLIDPQFSRFLRANVDLSPYETVLQQMTSTDGVTLFHRFDLTQGWVSDGQVDLERVDKDQRDETITLLNTCLGQALARYVLTGATER